MEAGPAYPVLACHRAAACKLPYPLSPASPSSHLADIKIPNVYEALAMYSLSYITSFNRYIKPVTLSSVFLCYLTQCLLPSQCFININSFNTPINSVSMVILLSQGHRDEEHRANNAGLGM